MTKSDRPRQPRRITGKWLALAMAIAVQLGFLAVLVFSVSWQNRKPEAVTAELYAPPVKAPAPQAAPAPQPPPEPPPPKPEPKIEPKAEPKAEPRPVPKVDKPDPHAAEIALKAKQEEERRKRAEAERREAEKKLREQKEAEEKRKADEKKKQDEKRLAEVRERQQRETEALRALAEREAQARAQAEREAVAKAQQAAKQAAEQSARSKAEADWIRRIQAKIKGNVIVPAELAGNPEAIFEVVQLPTGEIIDATLRKSSGNRAYDDAVQRAILKSSPLPRPERIELFERTLTLKFRPQD